MGRKPSKKQIKRVQLRLSKEVASVCDRMSSEEISKILEVAISSGIRPDKPLGATVQAVMRSKKIRTKTIARISTIDDCLIQIQFPEKRDDFRELVYQYGYRWNEWCWQRKVKPNVLCDRVAEIANVLLLNKFVVQVDHSEIRDRAITEQFEPEPLRRVALSTLKGFEGWFAFQYPCGNDFYDELMTLTAAKYADKLVRVPPEHFAEVEDFAEQNEFSFTPTAREALENARSLWASALLVIPAKKKRSKKAANPVDDDLVEIPDALKDDDT